MDLKEFSLALRRHWFAAFVAYALCLGAGAALALLPEKSYSAASVVAVRPAATAATPQNVVQTASFLIPIYVEQLGSSRLADTVAATLPPALADAEVGIQPTSDFGTGILRVRVTSPDPEAAAACSTGLATALTAEANAAEGSILTLSVIEEAGVPGAPESQARVILVAFLVLGVVSAALTAAARHKMVNALDTGDEIRRRLDAPVLGEIPRCRALRSSNTSVEQFLRDGPRDVLESFQTLRTNVELVMLDTHPDVIALTSFTSGEGKSTMAAALAVSMASVGNHVTLIDTDLRQPTVHERLGEPFGEGLANVTADPHHLVRRLRSGLRFLPAGVPDRHPADVIAFALPRALDALRSDDGLIVLDSPPLSGIAETAYIATVARHVILVLDPSGSNLPELERSMARLRESGVVLLGVVLNGTRRRRGRRSNPYYNFEYAAPAPVMDERELAAPSGVRVRSSR